ncbi:NADH:ubiquinone oxidoreductase complex I intermediate-associated protein 30 [Ceratobasidium sp. AG-I]|nr:NADH:ubiquinone oxidoreductase complex I intermediate-associated protein 30 [Ceratobasidium sp. AG-I]
MRVFPPWHIDKWEAVDDRVRGGKSVSEFCQRTGEAGVWFSGTLDITALGGAGFASQRFQFREEPLHLPTTQYTGIHIELAPRSSALETPNEFTLVLNTTPITTRPDGRVASRVGWEATFSNSQSSFDLPFGAFQATYRGRPVEPAPTLDSSDVYDLSIMCRSAFGRQSGHFELYILGLGAIEK